ncbi:MAG: hypothetical protein M0D54_10465 [Hyphomonadaceae bacterium JAD_PAG50586_4]|nr:MAG: hypothetical protein M0D54_10465 [Hyphomonadaceae bacterium JAD_PAG50586_4]
MHKHALARHDALSPEPRLLAPRGLTLVPTHGARLSPAEYFAGSEFAGVAAQNACDSIRGVVARRRYLFALIESVSTFDGVLECVQHALYYARHPRHPIESDMLALSVNAPPIESLVQVGQVLDLICGVTHALDRSAGQRWGSLSHGGILWREIELGGVRYCILPLHQAHPHPQHRTRKLTLVLIRSNVLGAWLEASPGLSGEAPSALLPRAPIPKDIARPPKPLLAPVRAWRLTRTYWAAMRNGRLSKMLAVRAREHALASAQCVAL